MSAATVSTTLLGSVASATQPIASTPPPALPSSSVQAMSAASSSSPACNSSDDCAAASVASPPSTNGLVLPAATTERRKSKPRVAPEDLIYDPDGFYLRAACVCVRDSTESEVLLVSSPNRGPDHWIVPGGKVQPGETSEMGAAREALEEAGAVGDLGRCLGSFDNAERRHRTRVYVLRVSHLLDQYEESKIRERQWFPVEEAKRKLAAGHQKIHSDYVDALASAPDVGNAADGNKKAVTKTNS